MAMTESDRTLEGGLRLRLIRPDDEPRLVALYDRLSRHTAYQRFFTVMRRLPIDWAHFLANVDYQTRLALVIERRGSVMSRPFSFFAILSVTEHRLNPFAAWSLAT